VAGRGGNGVEREERAAMAMARGEQRELLERRKP
jgi:hypothetical protein